MSSTPLDFILPNLFQESACTVVATKDDKDSIELTFVFASYSGQR